MKRKRSSTIVRAAVAAFAIGVALMSPPGRASAQAPAGSVSSLTGQAQDERAAKTFSLAQAMPVLVRDKITTRPASVATIMLTDQSQLEVHESTTITLDEHLVGPGGRISTHVGLISGLLRSFVHLTSTGSIPNFEVHTPNAIAAARATKYDTSHETGQARPEYPTCYEYTDGTVYEGTVEFRNSKNPNAPGLLVPAGYKVTVPCALAPVLISPLGAGGVGGIAGLTPVLGALGGTAVLGAIGVGAFAAADGFEGPPSSPSR